MYGKVLAQLRLEITMTPLHKVLVCQRADYKRTKVVVVFAKRRSRLTSSSG